MHLLDELICNPKKYNDLINSQNTSLTKNTNAVPLLAMSMAYTTIALNIKNFYAIEKTNRLSFLKKCLFANRYSFGILLKKGRESYEKEIKADGFEPNVISVETEIEHIYSFLNDTNTPSIQTVNTIVSRGLVHVFDMITEEDFRHVVHDELLIDYDIELNYAAIKDDMQKAFLEFNFDLDSKRTAQYLRYFHCAAPIEDIDYQCFYKPFFYGSTGLLESSAN